MRIQCIKHKLIIKFTGNAFMITFIQKILSYFPPLYKIARHFYKLLNREEFYRGDEWIFQKYNVDCYMDVGGNLGQTGHQVRSLGYKNLIVSYEPVEKLYQICCKEAKKDHKWHVHKLALGDKSGEDTIHVLGSHGGTSSILKPNYDFMQSHVHGEASQQIGKEKINIITLDNAIEDHTDNAQNIFIKADVQGFEKFVIAGAQKHLDKIIGCRLEMAINTNDYEKQDNLWDMINFMRKKGFVLTSFENGWYNHDTYEMLYVDGTFLNTNYKGNKHGSQ